jgi:hypothetical protein
MGRKRVLYILYYAGRISPLRLLFLSFTCQLVRDTLGDALLASVRGVGARSERKRGGDGRGDGNFLSLGERAL